MRRSEEGLRDGSSRPLVSPGATKTEIVGKIIYLRQHYHFGPQQISRSSSATTTFRSVTRGSGGSSNARLNRLRLPRYKRHDRRWKRYEKPSPRPSVQVDVKFIEPIGGGRKKHYSSRHRRLHPEPRPAGLPPEHPEDRHPVHRLRPREAPVPGFESIQSGLICLSSTGARAAGRGYSGDVFASGPDAAWRGPSQYARRSRQLDRGGRTKPETHR